METTEEGPEATQAPDQGQVAAGPAGSQTFNETTMEVGAALPNRPSSPAVKRPASDLEDENLLEVKSPSVLASTQALASSPPADPMDQSDFGLTTDHEPSVDGTLSPSQAKTNGESEKASRDAVPIKTGSTIATNFHTGADETLPSIDEQIARVTALSLKPLRDRQRGYVVSCKWLLRVKARSSEGIQESKGHKEALEGDVGPVDNSDLTTEGASQRGLKDEEGEPFVPIRPGLVMGEDYEIFPQEAWDLIILSYGHSQNSQCIVRFVHNTNPDGGIGMENLQYETYPPLFTILKLRNESSGLTTEMLKAEEATPVRLISSRFEKYQDFLKQVKSLAGVSLRTKVRAWRILGGDQAATAGRGMTPATSRSASPAPAAAANALKTSAKKLVLDLNTFLDLEEGTQREKLDMQDETANENYNGHLTLSRVGLNQDETIVLEERIGGPGGGEWVSAVAAKTAGNYGVPISVTTGGNTTVQNRVKSKNGSRSRKSSPAPGGGMMTRGRAQRSGRALGTSGLTNLGNTCYMNSALQCVRSVEELTQYFRLGKYKEELNPSNPLSHNGDVARSYANLLDQLYASTTSGAFSPKAFKHTVGRYGPSFSGYGQQDSQEFLGFLLDGLQEDLNRIQKKPYIEKPDSTDDMVHDPKALRELADKCWDIYKARNDSVIADLFAGTYKSTLVCPVCEKVSITFDPFNNLTLQIPVESVWSKDIFFFPLYRRPIRVSVDMDKNGSIKALKEFVGARVKVDIGKLYAAEIFKSKIYKVYEDNVPVSEAIQQDDDVGIFEVEAIPTNLPPPKKKEPKSKSLFASYAAQSDDDQPPNWDSPMAEQMLVPIFHRNIKDRADRYLGTPGTVFGVPQYIIVDAKAARDYDLILKKVLAKVATMTTANILHDMDVAGDALATPEDEDMVITTAEDADSSAGTKINVDSVNGEDGFVDVSMRESADGPEENSNNATTQQSPTPKNPKILDPQSSIPNPLRSLFRMRAYQQKGQLVPTAWNDISSDRQYTLIESRLPRPSASASPAPQADSTQYRVPGQSQSSESDDELNNDIGQSNHSFQARSSNLGSDSDEELPPMGSVLTRRKKPARNTSLLHGQQSAPASSDEDVDDGPLLRLGEGIILDWNPEAHDALFGSNGEGNNMRGAATWENIHLLPDEELRKRRELRKTRRQKGVSLDDCLDEFGKEEILSENDAWYCPRCKEHRRATKKFELWKSPDILVMHLKRFSASRGMRDKLDVLVDFPIEGLDLNQRVGQVEDGKPLIYDLFAVDNHFGGLGGGHYTAIARNFIDGVWYDYNDTFVAKRNPQQAVISAAYLLFYRRRSEQPLGGPVFQRILEEANHESSASDASESDSGMVDGQVRSGSSTTLSGKGADFAHGLSGEDKSENEQLYSSVEGGGAAAAAQKLQAMDVDEGIEADNPVAPATPFHDEPSWSFRQVTAAPPASDDEDIMSNVTGKAAGGGSSDEFSDPEERMNDFEGFDEEASFHATEESGRFRASEGLSPSGSFVPSGAMDDHDLYVDPPPVPEDDATVADIVLENGEGNMRADE
ncbi:MAG: CSN-associated deubiquitinating enzyme Ubp12 [Piccolia ochrophora]|nr:MAG: CSN-associated deubiquitinating enzyme Ubp12 [Piccolia ochrophora]